MLSDEEKKAIEQCRRYIKVGAILEYVDEDIDGNIRAMTSGMYHIETILNLIEKQNKKLKEIEAIVDTTPYVAYTSYGDILYESDEILEIIRSDGNE